VEIFFLIPRERIPRARAFQTPPYVDHLRKDQSLFRVFGVDGCLFPNTATAFGLDDIGMYEGLFVKRFATYIRELVDDRFFQPGSFHAFRGSVKDPDNRFLDLLNLKYHILPKGSPIPPERLRKLSMKLDYDGEVRILERTKVMPRVMIRHQADFVSDDIAALNLLKQGYDIRNRVVLTGTPAEKKTDPGLTAVENSSVKVIDYEPNRKVFDVDMDAPGYLVINDVQYPGWQARVDGEAQEVLTANYLFQAVRVPSGNHRVELSFKPFSFRAGLLIALLSLGSLAWWALRRDGIRYD
jgi:hypothetical protein